MPERLRTWVAGQGLRSMLRAPQSLLCLPDGQIWDGALAFASFEAWCVANAGSACELQVSAAGLSELVCDPELPLADDAAALEWARALLQHYHGEAALQWALASWQTRRLRGVSVLQGLDLQQLQQTAHRHRVRLRALRPWWAAVLPRALRRQPGLRAGAARLLIVEAACVVNVELDDGELVGVTLRRLDAAAGDALNDWLIEQPPRATVVLGYGLQGPVAPALQLEVLGSLDGAAPERHWLQGGGP